jgi:5-methylcytosine-specific restriction protein A
MPSKIPYHRPSHVVTAARDYERQRWRQEDKNFYSADRWRGLRASFLRRFPLCVMCKAEGISTLAVDLDHIIDRKVRPDLAYDPANLQGLCKPHHNAKRAM